MGLSCLAGLARPLFQELAHHIQRDRDFPLRLRQWLTSLKERFPLYAASLSANESGGVSCDSVATPVTPNSFTAWSSSHRRGHQPFFSGFALLVCGLLILVGYWLTGLIGSHFPGVQVEQLVEQVHVDLLRPGRVRGNSRRAGAVRERSSKRRSGRADVREGSGYESRVEAVVVPALLPDELIDDRALRELKNDAFGHKDFVDELEGVVRHTPTPTTISIYAPWGSGKTSLAHLLEGRFEHDKQVRFVRFDAMKYVETPLRRHFIATLAERLEVEEHKFRKGLYEKTTRNSVKVPWKAVARLVGFFFAAIGLLTIAALIAACIYAVLADGPTGREFRDAIGWLGPKLFVPASVLAVLSAFASRQFIVEQTTDAPASPEEFEERFRELVERTIGQRSLTRGGAVVIDDEKKRLCVFVDELDRCSPDEIVTTLDSIRTFFEIEGCVFIVAADQQALEEALLKAVKQETPANAIDPYYSAGTAHLDKVFHPQLPLPPIKSQRLSEFAVELVQDRPGIWQILKKAGVLEDTLSVLVPTHVHSPRRVKALLNSFLLLYRTAWRRSEQGAIARGLESRAPEIAKLACMRLEFPLFARDLGLDARMPQLVLAILEKENFPGLVEADVRARAEQWAHRRLAVADLIVDPDASDRDSVEPGDAGDGASDREEPPTRIERVRQEHATQLLRYLRKTRRVPGPHVDLIHLESAGAHLDLDPAEADAIERAAVDGDSTAVVELVAQLDAEKQRAAYRLLVYVVRRSSVGVEGANAVATFLRALGEKKEPLGELADPAAAAVAPHTFSLEPADLSGALALSLETSHEGGAELRRQVRDAEASRSDPVLCAAVVAAADQLIETEEGWIGAAFRTLLTDDGEAAVTAVLAQSEDVGLKIIDASMPALNTYLQGVDELGDEETGEARRGLEGVLDGLTQENRALAQRFASSMLRTESDLLVDEVSERVERLAPIDDIDLAHKLLMKAHAQSPDVYGRWFAAIPVETASEIGDPRLLAEPIEAAWSSYLEGSSGEDELRKAMAALAPFAEAGLTSPSEQVTNGVRSLGSTITDPETGQRRLEQLRLANEITRLGLVENGAVSTAAVGAVEATLASPLQPGLDEHLLELLDEFAVGAKREELEHLRESAPQSGWPALGATVDLLVTARLNSEFGLDLDSGVTGGRVRELLEGQPGQFQRGLELWLREFARDPDEVWEAVEPLADPELLTASAAEALRFHCDWWLTHGEADAHNAFLMHVLQAAIPGPMPAEFMRALLLPRGDHRRIAAKLGELREQVNTPEEAGRLLNVWAVLEPTDEQVLRTLANEILLPLAREGPLYFDVMLEHAGLATQLPKDRREAFRKLLRATAKELQRADETESRFKAMGLVRRKGFLKRTDADT